MSNLYKFLSNEIVDKLAIDDNYIDIKLSSLEDYNDPFEYFLTIDFKQNSEMIAFYLEMLEMNMKNLVSCFSKSPTITPLWAHYATNSKGFCLELDENKLEDELNDQKNNFRIDDIFYSNEYDDNLKEILERAFFICKPRYTYFLQSSLIKTAYFRKQLVWNYEQERRLIISPDTTSIINLNDIQILLIRTTNLKSIIVGKKMAPELKTKLKKLSTKLGCNFFETRFARSTLNTFFINDNKTYIFKDGSIVEATEHCKVCHEPFVLGKTKKCSWCNITVHDKEHARSINPYAIFNSIGILDEYISEMDKITFGSKK